VQVTQIGVHTRHMSLSLDAWRDSGWKAIS
jgi:hypothetical protein